MGSEGSVRQFVLDMGADVLIGGWLLGTARGCHSLLRCHNPHAAHLQQSPAYRHASETLCLRF